MDAFAAPSFVNIALLDSHSMLSLVKPRLLSTASTSKSGLHVANAVVSSGCHGRPVRWRCNLLRRFQAAP